MKSRLFKKGRWGAEESSVCAPPVLHHWLNGEKRLREDHRNERRPHRINALVDGNRVIGRATPPLYGMGGPAVRFGFVGAGNIGLPMAKDIGFSSMLVRFTPA